MQTGGLHAEGEAGRAGGGISVALARSTLSTPTPALPTTFRRPPAAWKTSFVTCTEAALRHMFFRHLGQPCPCVVICSLSTPSTTCGGCDCNFLQCRARMRV